MFLSQVQGALHSKNMCGLNERRDLFLGIGHSAQRLPVFVNFIK